MDVLLREVLRELTAIDPAAAARLREIMGSNLTPLALLRALYQLLMENLIDRALLTRLLNMYVRAGVLDAAIVDLAVAEAEADLAKAAAKASAEAAAKAARKARLLRWARGGLWAALIYLLGAAILDSMTDLQHDPAGNGPCAVNATPVPIDAEESSYGPKSALKDALDEIKRKCANASVNCSDPLCETCEKDPFITFAEVKSRLFWYTAVVTADCRCWCK